MEPPELDQSFAAECADIPRILGEGQVIPPGGAAPADGTAQAASAGLTQDALEMGIGGLFDVFALLSGDGGEFWQLKPLEKSNLAKVWLPILGPLFDAWGLSSTAPLIFAGTMTLVTVGPRLVLERKRHASVTATTETASSGDIPSSQAPPEAESPLKPIDLSAALNAA